MCAVFNFLFQIYFQVGSFVQLFQNRPAYFHQITVWPTILEIMIPFKIHTLPDVFKAGLDLSVEVHDL